MSSSSSWSDDLPDDILLLIVKKVTRGSDFMSFSHVCSSWRSISKQERKRFRPVLPGILTRQGFKSERHPFESLAKLKGLPTLSLPAENVVCGSHQGWILMRKESNSCKELVLINPVTQVRSKLPFSSYASRIIFSANPMDCNCYMVVVHSWGHLRCCKLGDMGWTFVESSWGCSLGFVDAIYYRGKLYALLITRELCVCDDITASPPMMIKLVSTPHYAQLNTVLKSRSLQPESPSRIFFLVESGQELLLVHRKRGDLLSEGLEVHRLDLGGLRWDRVTNLGEHALFLGKSQSFSLSELDVGGIKGNHIYYIQEGSCSVSVFSLEKSSVEVESLLSEKSPGIWFMPQLFS